MTPAVKYGIKVAGVGLYGFLVSLQAGLPGISGDDLATAAIAGGIGALVFAGLAKTGLENPGGE